MKKFDVQLTHSALKDLDQINNYYMSHVSTELALELILLIEGLIDSLKVLPEQRSEEPILSRETGTRYHQVVASPFRIIYRVENALVLIVMIFHQRQSVQKALRNRLLM